MKGRFYQGGSFHYFTLLLEEYNPYVTGVLINEEGYVLEALHRGDKGALQVHMKLTGALGRRLQ